MTPIAHLRTAYPEKFGVPRQSRLVPSAQARLVFEPPYRHEDCIRGLDAFTHLWLIWEFSRNAGHQWNPTVRPPRLGGNTRLGVFATRSPFRPNPIGLSAVVLEGIDSDTPEGPVLLISGADLVDGTPIYDIKPYIPYADSIPEATGGFTDSEQWQPLETAFAPGLELPPACTPAWRQTLIETLAQDPRPAYQNDPDRLYHLILSPCEITFRVVGSTAIVAAVSLHG